MKCFYHEDLDGRCSASIIQRKYQDCECIGVNYEKPFPIDEIEQDEPIFIVDFTPNSKEDWDKILARTEGQVVWIDHHWSNINKYPELNKELDGIRVEDKPSGALLTWQFLHKDEPEPLAVFLTSDFDTWTHSDKRSEAFNAGMSIIDHSPDADIWKTLLAQRDADISSVFGPETDAVIERTIDGIVAHGQTILAYRRAEATENLSRFGWETEFEGIKAVACCNDEKGSRFFDEKLDTYDLAISYCHNGEKFIVGLYSKNKKVNCAELAKKHGGGGHPGASGFQAKELPFKFGKRLE